MEDELQQAAEASRLTSLSRRGFISQLTVAGLVTTALPAWSISRLESNQTTLTLSSFDEESTTQAEQHSTITEDRAMPLVQIDAIEGRSHAEIESLLNAAHRAVVTAFGVPERDRYQIYTAHPKTSMVVLDTGLGIKRTDQVVVFTVFSKQRTEPLKRKLYTELTRQLQAAVSIPPSDVVICIIENSGADWSFGNGEPQFLTGKL